MEFDLLILTMRKNEAIYRNLTKRMERGKIARIEENIINSVPLMRYRLLKQIAERFQLDSKGLLGLKFQLPFMAIIVGSACTLKCKNCANFCADAPAQTRRYNVSRIIAHMEQILDAVDEIEKLHIQGGEPFIYSDLSVLLTYLIQQPKIKKIQIATNGTVIPADEVLELCQNDKLEIRISHYGAINREKIQKLVAVLDNKRIANRNYRFMTRNETWYDLGGIDFKKTESDEAVSKRFEQCRFSKCLSLENGRISYCPRAYTAGLLQNFNAKCGNYLDVEQADFTMSFRKFYFERKFMESCRYCVGTHDAVEIPAAIQK